VSKRNFKIKLKLRNIFFCLWLCCCKKPEARQQNLCNLFGICPLLQIDGIEVLAVRRRVADVIHYVPVPLDVSRQVNVVVDWTRRWDHMQQHSGFC